MLFKSRTVPSFKERLRLLLWPRRSFSRSMRYYGKRILRITASPHAVAVGLAIGVFAAFTPFFGLHLIIAIALAYFLSGNVAAAALGTAVANPLTIPLIWGSTFELGKLILSGDMNAAPPLHLTKALETMRFEEVWAPLLKPMLFGSLVLGAAFALIIYFATLYAVSSSRKRRLHYLESRQSQYQETETL